jgi:hypothetical protein
MYFESKPCHCRRFQTFSEKNRYRWTLTFINWILFSKSIDDGLTNVSVFLGRSFAAVTARGVGFSHGL